jgi:excisionase family DNA binding protein
MGTERLLTPEDAAKALVVKSSTVREWLRTGRLKGVKMGRLWRVREGDLEEFLKVAAQAPNSPFPIEHAPRVLQRKREKEPKLKPGQKKRMPADFNRKLARRRSARSPK